MNESTTYTVKIGHNGGLSVGIKVPGYQEYYCYFTTMNHCASWFKEQFKPKPAKVTVIKSTPEKKPASG